MSTGSNNTVTTHPDSPDGSDFFSVVTKNWHRLQNFTELRKTMFKFKDDMNF